FALQITHAFNLRPADQNIGSVIEIDGQGANRQATNRGKNRSWDDAHEVEFTRHDCLDDDIALANRDQLDVQALLLEVSLPDAHFKNQGGHGSAGQTYRDGSQLLRESRRGQKNRDEKK